MFEKTKFPLPGRPDGPDRGIENVHSSPLATAPWCCLTDSDVQLLEEAARIHGGRDSAVHRALAHKIQNTVVQLSEDVPAGYVRLNSRVTFRINGLRKLNRVLVHWNSIAVPGRDLSLATPWGIALLGTRPGYEGPVYWRGGSSEVIRVEAVEAGPNHDASRQRTHLHAAGARVIGLASRRMAPSRARLEPTDDRGPSAA